MVLAGITRKFGKSLGFKREGFKPFNLLSYVVMLGASIGLINQIDGSWQRAILVGLVAYILLLLINFRAGLKGSLLLSLLQTLSAPILVIIGFIRALTWFLHGSNTGGDSKSLQKVASGRRF